MKNNQKTLLIIALKFERFSVANVHLLTLVALCVAGVNQCLGQVTACVINFHDNGQVRDVIDFLPEQV